MLSILLAQQAWWEGIATRFGSWGMDVLTDLMSDPYDPLGDLQVAPLAFSSPVKPFRISFFLMPCAGFTLQERFYSEGKYDIYVVQGISSAWPLSVALALSKWGSGFFCTSNLGIGYRIRQKLSFLGFSGGVMLSRYVLSLRSRLYIDINPDTGQPVVTDKPYTPSAVEIRGADIWLWDPYFSFSFSKNLGKKKYASMNFIYGVSTKKIMIQFEWVGRFILPWRWGLTLIPEGLIPVYFYYTLTF